MEPVRIIGGIRTMAAQKPGKIAIENVIRPGKTYNVDAEKYEAMRKAFLKALPKSAGAMKLAEIRTGILAHLSEEVFPGGEKAGWWMKAVQLDLEAKGVVKREKTTPIRLKRV
jgi:hypothetical protein